MLIELNKVNAPSLLLEDYNYFINKAVNQYINKRYNIYDTTQQTTDDLRVLKSTATIPVEEKNLISEKYGSLSDKDLFGDGNMFGATYEFELPKDYLHMLNCTCVYKVQKPYKCYPVGKYWTRRATRLTADAWPDIQDNAYMCPSYRRPYYYIHNVNQQENLPTNIYNKTLGSTDQYITFKEHEEGKLQEVKNQSVYPSKISLKNIDKNKDLGEVDLIDRPPYTRTANPTSIRCEIRYGKDTEVFKLKYVLVDYIKAPQYIELTQEQVDRTIDQSQILEFPDYICQEIINELVHLVMENASDQRIQTHPVVSQSIANPAQQQQQPQKAS